MTIALSPTRLLAIAAILLLAMLSIGGALAERLEERAAGDRFTVGAALSTIDAGDHGKRLG